MSQASKRSIVKVVFVVASVAFSAVSMVPLIGAFKDLGQQQKSQPENKQAAQIKLEDQARGLELVLQREPENQAALKGLVETRLQLFRQGKGDIKGIIEPLEKLAKLNPENTQYMVLLAQAKLGIGDTEGSAAAYRSVLRTKPGDVRALQGMVVLLLKQKRPEAAIGLLKDTLSNAPKANKIQPGSVDPTAVNILLGNVYASQKRYDQALAVNDQAIKNDPQDFRPVLAKALLLKEQGKINEAKPLFDKAASLAPPDYKDEINKSASLPPKSTLNPTPNPTPTSGK